ncbi:MAG TPA: cobalt transporter CbiM [Anaerolineae bacterium]|nr:cobalt transporter CbiM [Anaerolineae bacterium]HOQ98627.1 cobalt transporter CbiM [Anaerolineae bacterium]HPL27166.1 cobalt transporter CbiM [Anaerolineae bacterium]
MHVPDGYLSPVTCAVMFALALPFWVLGLRRVRETLSARSAPLIALMAAFSFVIMMFNVPLPGGTTGHATGAALAAIVLGPEVAAIAVSVALLIQALLFGDGGILAIGANCFNIAVVIPFVSAAVYRWLASGASSSARRRVAAAALGGYVGLTVAAFLTAVEFGIQPALFHAADGAPLYAPYPLAVAIPAMVIPHLLVASVVEAALTGLVVAYLLRINPQLLRAGEGAQPAAEAGGRRGLRVLWLVLAALVVAAPLGLLAPGTAWGEWGAEELAELGLGAVPRGLERLGALWGAPLPDYDLPSLGNAGLSYVLSAVIGVAVTVLVVWLFAALLASRRPAEGSR